MINRSNLVPYCFPVPSRYLPRCVRLDKVSDANLLVKEHQSQDCHRFCFTDIDSVLGDAVEVTNIS